MERRRQQQWGGRIPYLQPAALPQSVQTPTTSPEIYPNPDVFGLESVLSNLRVSSDYDLRRYRHLTVPVLGPSGPGRGGADVAFGPRSGPVTGYTVTSLGAQNGSVDSHPQVMGRAHHNVGPARICTIASSNGGGSILRDAASAHPTPWYGGGGGGGDSLVSRNREIIYHGYDPFLPCKEPFPNVPCLDQNFNWYQNSVQPVDTSASRTLSFLNALTPHLNNEDEIRHGKQQCAILNLDELRGKIVSLAMDQNGCRILQDNLIFLDDKGTEVVLSEVIEFEGDLMKNQSGSYLIQKLFSVCSDEQKTNMILAVTKKPFQLIAICLNQFGARAMVKLLEDLSSPQQRSLAIAALCPGAVTLASDPNGHLVILYCLKNFSFEYNKHLINEVSKNCFVTATNRNGCCVLQSCLESSCGEAREILVNEIIANAVQLSENPYGNYVVQHLLGQNIPGAEEHLQQRLEGKFASLACNKYASNVVEKFFVKTGDLSTKVIKELISSPNLSMLLVDPFGNYVIQKALKVAKGDVYNALIDQIMVNAPSMQSNIYGKMILGCLSRGGNIYGKMILGCLSRGGRGVHGATNILYSK